MSRVGLAAYSALILVCCWLSGCGRRPEPEAAASPNEDAARKAFFDLVARIEAPLENASDSFESAAREGNPGSLSEAAHNVLVHAVEAREALERLRVEPALRDARREELVFLNHIVVGLRRFERSRCEPRDLEDLASVVRRARAHQALARGRPVTPPAVKSF